MPKSPYLTGEDRIEYSSVFGRAIRSGALLNFKVADQDRLAEWIQAGDTAKAVAMLEVLRPLYLDMNRILLEWALSWGQRVREEHGDFFETELTSRVHSVWSEVVNSQIETSEQAEAAKKVLKGLSADVRRGRSDCQPIAEQLNAVPAATWHEVVNLVNAKKSESALEKFQLFVRQSRAVHDFLCQYHWVYSTESEKLHGQDFSERIMMEGFQACSMYEGFFKLIVQLTPEGVVALMSEHLRGHFSGEDRRGKVEVTESPESFTIHFDGCGSGGAMRRKFAGKSCKGLENYPKASPSTWNMTGVSAFCAHCAQNEIFMVKRFGFPIWVVNYEKDPHKPCSWTIYKDYTQVPESFYERIGFKKDPEKMAKLLKD